MGTFQTSELIETFVNYHENIKKCVCLIYDPHRSQRGTLALRAIRLRDSFIDLYKQEKLSGKDMREASVSWKDVFVDVPIKVCRGTPGQAHAHRLQKASPTRMQLVSAASAGIQAALGIAAGAAGFAPELGYRSQFKCGCAWAECQLEPQQGSTTQQEAVASARTARCAVSAQSTHRGAAAQQRAPGRPGAALNCSCLAEGNQAPSNTALQPSWAATQAGQQEGTHTRFALGIAPMLSLTSRPTFAHVPCAAQVTNSSLAQALVCELETDAVATAGDVDRLNLSVQPFMERNIQVSCRGVAWRRGGPVGRGTRRGRKGSAGRAGSTGQGWVWAAGVGAYCRNLCASMHHWRGSVDAWEK